MTDLATSRSIDPRILAKGFARPDVLVSTAWLAENLDDPSIRLLESNEDLLLYDTGHIPGAQKIDWTNDLNDAVVRDYLDRAGFEALLRRFGIDESTTVIFYGDKNNWWATYAFWVFQLFGFEHARLLDGGRAAWLAEGRTVTTDTPTVVPSRYVAPERNDAPIRAFLPNVLKHVQLKKKLIARPMSSRAGSCTCPSIRRKVPCAAVMYPGRAAYRGRERPTVTGPTSPQTHCARFTRAKRASPPETT